jgi:hypothetical protein
VIEDVDNRGVDKDDARVDGGLGVVQRMRKQKKKGLSSAEGDLIRLL